MISGFMNNLAALVAAFAEELIGNDRTEFTFQEALDLAEESGLSVATAAIRALQDWGFRMQARQPPKAVRGFQTSSNDRFYGPGSDKMHGGAAYDSMMIQMYGMKQ